MLDHHDTRIWADNHHHFSAAVADLVRQLRQTFAVLTRIQYDSPWSRRGSIG